jgi:CDP-6-deoxy-D-xylo-4-hexulose-3-dehydrase
MSERDDIVRLAEEFIDSRGEPTFVPGETYIPSSGKVVDGEDCGTLVDAALDMWLTEGRYVKAFEKELAEFVGVRDVRTTVSGSAANLLAFSSLTSPQLERPIEEGSEVLTLAASFPTTVAPIIQNKCVPVFVDVDIETANVNIESLHAAVSDKTRAIVLAHTLGNPFEIEQVRALADEHNLYLIEDSCDALGATYGGQSVGTFGDLATLSFYPAHHITTGEGGAVLSGNTVLTRIVESFRDWGRDCWCAPGNDNTCKKRFSWKMGDLPFGYDHKYIYSHLGYNMKMTDMQGAIGLSQLQKAKKFIERRRANFSYLHQLFIQEGLDEHFLLPKATANSEPSWFGFLLTIKDSSPLKRNEVLQYLECAKIGTRMLFGGNLLWQPAFKDQNIRVSGGLKNTEKIARDSFWIGVWPGIDDVRLQYIITKFKSMLEELVN